MPCLIVPGLHSSGPDHWQTRWEAERDDTLRVELGDWDDPQRISWIAALDRAVKSVDGAPVLVAHSLGCLAVAWWASVAGDWSAGVAGALLVAPPDVERIGFDARVRRFAPLPRRPMPFPTILVASLDDPHADFKASSEMAALWGVRLVDIGAAGHINADSGLGSWKAGQDLVEALVRESSFSFWRRPRAGTTARAWL